MLAREAVDALRVRPDGVYVDCTFGRGGHSRLILATLGERGRLIALDRDPEAVESGRRWEDARFCIMHSSFGRLEQVLDDAQVGQVHGVLLDLGVSSPQIDDPARGFSFRMDGPLDMRMDTTRGESAARWLAHASERDIREVVKRHGEERFAKQVAAAIVAARARGAVETTRQLAKIVAEAVRTREAGQDPATRTFQAVRIHINQELEELSLVLPQAVRRLTPGGRLAVISFHSLEDRAVKRFLREHSRVPRALDGLPLRQSELPVPPLSLVGASLTPGAEELASNPRARSARLRVAERTEGALC